VSGVPFAHNDLSCLGIITEVIADLTAWRAQLRTPRPPDQHEHGQPFVGDRGHAR
jgi:hypothetical protein